MHREEMFQIRKRLWEDDSLRDVININEIKYINNTEGYVKCHSQRIDVSHCREMSYTKVK
jgi:hypothetical protein